MNTKYFKTTLLPFALCMMSSPMLTAAYPATYQTIVNVVNLSPHDMAFARKLAMNGILESKLGQVAQTNGTSIRVKKFGAKMITDHVQSNNELVALAAKKGALLPATLDASHQKVLTSLSKLWGEKFDKAYVNQMIKQHEKELKESTMISTKCTDPALRAFAAKNAHIVAEHLGMIKHLQAEMNL